MIHESSRNGRGNATRVVCALALLAALAVGSAGVAVASDRLVALEDVELVGNTRTSRETVLLYLPLRPGDLVDASELIAAVEELRRSELFDSVDFHTRPGSERGRVRLVLEVEETGVSFRLGLGYRDLNGWYLIPAQLQFDNRFGRGDRAHVQFKIGYRLAGVELHFSQPRFGDEGRNDWGTTAYVYGLNRLYFIDGIEYVHDVARGGIDAHVGRRVGSRLRWELGARLESVDADSSARANQDDALADIGEGDELPFEALPASIAADVGENSRVVPRASLTWDSRSRSRLAATPTGGAWGRIQSDAFLKSDGNHVTLTADARAYGRLAGGVLAGRARAGWIEGDASAFYDRFYLGGLYTVRGVPSQSLSPPEGNSRFWSANLEFRAPLVGHGTRPRLSGFLFVDAGYAWDGNRPTFEDTAVSVGYGLRLAVPWFEVIGLDFGVPLTESPVQDAFHVNAAIGWNF